MRTVGIIPARLESSRLPRKVLADLHGRPLLWHVCQRAAQSQCLDALYIATDSPEVEEAAKAWGTPVLLTSRECRSGTDRLAETLDRVKAEFFVNIQGDEPLVDPGMLDALVQRARQTDDDIVTPVRAIDRLDDLTSPNVVKAVVNREGRALYFSRSPVPHVRDLPMTAWLDKHRFWAHIGVYGYRRHALAAFPRLPESPLERVEKLEQLRFLESGYSIATVETAYRSVGVDTAEDLERVRGLLSKVA